MHLILPPITAARPDWQDATPVSGIYNDSYFLPGQGPAESRAVFIEANALPARFAALPWNGVFVIGETGFGTGLNQLLAAQCFLDTAPASARLHLLSAELHPLEREDLKRALAQWPALSSLAKPLLEQYPPAAPGLHRLRLHGQIDLTLMLGDALTLWQHCQADIDAWFLDGFAPARNPGMWSPELMSVLASRSRPGATLGTFTAAGNVRRALQAAGFQVVRTSGFGAKRHRLTATFPGQWQARKSPTGHAVVAGAGLAGATTARALAERGWQVTLIDPLLAPDNGASEHLAGVIYTTASAHLHAQNRFYQTSLVHALRRLGHLGYPRRDHEGRLAGVVQHLTDARVRGKTLAAIDSAAWPAELLCRKTADSVMFNGAGYLQPIAWCHFLIDHASIETRCDAIAAFEPTPAVRLTDISRIEANAVVLCTASATATLPGLEWLPLRTVRGQVTMCRATPASGQWQQPHCHTGYLTPAIGGIHCLGATFDRDRFEAVMDELDDRTNLTSLAQNLPDHWSALGGERIEVVGRHAGLRCQSPDTLPLVGALPDPAHNPHELIPGMWLNIAHGSRGLAHTPLCADLIADSICGHPLPVDTSIMDALAPERFILRQRKKQPDWTPWTTLIPDP